MPDAELLVVRYLLAQLGDDAYVCTVGPPDEQFHDLVPVVRIWRRGGTFVHRKQLDEAVVDVDIWHTELGPLNELTELVRALCEDMQHHRDDTANGVVTRTSEVVGPQRLPEDDPLLYRAGFTVALLVRPLVRS